MERRMASVAEFSWQDSNILEHKPTGARFMTTLGTSAVSSFEVGLLATPLEDGGDYNLESVLDLVWRLVEARARRDG